MSLSPKQKARYFREWSAICKVQGWKSSDDARRYSVHTAAKIIDRRTGKPKSSKDFSNADFDAYLAMAAALQNRVDIRDRPREREEHAIERMGAALAEITGGRAYEQAIVGNMHDRESLVDVPLDPIPDQAIEGRVARQEVSKSGRRRNVYRPDLENHKLTLKNRLSKFLTRIKKGEVACPAGREWWPGSANNDVITAIIDGMVCVRLATGGGRSVPNFITPAEYDRLKRERTAPAPAVQAPETAADYTPTAAAIACGYEGITDEKIPF